MEPPATTVPPPTVARTDSISMRSPRKHNRAVDLIDELREACELDLRIAQLRGADDARRGERSADRHRHVRASFGAYVVDEQLQQRGLHASAHVDVEPLVAGDLREAGDGEDGVDAAQRERIELDASVAERQAQRLRRRELLFRDLEIEDGRSCFDDERFDRREAAAEFQIDDEVSGCGDRRGCGRESDRACDVADRRRARCRRSPCFHRRRRRLRS